MIADKPEEKDAAGGGMPGGMPGGLHGRHGRNGLWNGICNYFINL